MRQETSTTETVKIDAEPFHQSKEEEHQRKDNQEVRKMVEFLVLHEKG